MIYEEKYSEAYAEVETVSGSGLFTTAKMYQWECYKN